MGSATHQHQQYSFILVAGFKTGIYLDPILEVLFMVYGPRQKTLLPLRFVLMKRSRMREAHEGESRPKASLRVEMQPLIPDRNFF
ncbi:hypothetical protein X474_23395 [Dethiosulfatarculus sandiegensis]|uniref:Uncharacterized protein n=1 Tax=Dethiosulfatarculus sandiegensis TaxID=1429043 RepID=A0A0D2HLZ8_9BACT|nr:hypothetical protein X474_23395 [Dethiosulfatarculus sandiegensis]